jgi:hypothetical protein
MSPDRGVLCIVIHDRRYYEGRGDVAGLRCETWGEASAEFSRRMTATPGTSTTDIVGAFVPLP